MSFPIISLAESHKHPNTFFSELIRKNKISSLDIQQGRQGRLRWKEEKRSKWEYATEGTFQKVGLGHWLP